MQPAHHTVRVQGFSLVELLLSMTVLTSIMLMFVGLLDQTQKTWEYSRTQISQFREARLAYDIISKNVSQATLNAYFEQVDSRGRRASDFTDPKDFIPKEFQIQSELHFKTMQANELIVNGMTPGPGHALFFQAPLGSTSEEAYGPLTNLLNGRGYFVAVGSDADYSPLFVRSISPPKIRYRLMEFLPPTEKNQVYAAAKEATATNGKTTDRAKWITVPLAAPRNAGTLRPLAENIVAFIVSPREAVADTGRATGVSDMAALIQADTESTARVAPNYAYDSAMPLDASRWPVHTLPPLIMVTMVAIDETTAMRLEQRYGQQFMKTFIPSNWMQSSGKYQTDLTALIDAFNLESSRTGGVDISYKVFTSTIRINGAKWSVPPEGSAP